MKPFTYLKKLFKKKKTIKFGWKKDNLDPRDIKFKIEQQHALPPMVDLRSYCPPVYDQGNIGSCTANSLAAAYQFEEMKQKGENFIPSRLFIYYNERALEGNVNTDSGAAIRDGIKTMVTDGVCPETIWKYSPNKFAIKPTKECYDAALNNQVVEYLRITPHNLYEVKHCISDGYPVVFGFMIYESFMDAEVARTGIAPMPKSNEILQGGHAVLAVGYDDSMEALIVRNSWGSDWGIDGYFYLPYGFVTEENLSADYWTIRLVE